MTDFKVRFEEFTPTQFSTKDETLESPTFMNSPVHNSFFPLPTPIRQTREMFVLRSFVSGPGSTFYLYCTRYLVLMFYK